MICKVLIFDRQKEVKIYRNYCETLSNEEVIDKVVSSSFSNIISNIVYKQYSDVYICLIIDNENEMYAISLINLFIEHINSSLPIPNALHFTYHFSTLYSILDNMIVGGYIINTRMYLSEADVIQK